MSSYLTDYGKLKAISSCNIYEDNRIKDCVLCERTDLHTPLGVLTPQYEHTGVRRKYTYSVSFFQNGKMRRIALNEQTMVETPIGGLPAELITFYENGSIKKLFPLNGQLSGYWEEEDEYGLSQELYFNMPFGSFRARIIGIGFYENGAVRSLTLWPKEIISIHTPLGEQRVRIGFSLYSGGNLQSFEPADPVDVMTPIGLIAAYDTNAAGISADRNSLNLTEDGRIKGLTTSNTKIIVAGHDSSTKIYAPAYIEEMDEYAIFFRPLRIDFEKGKVRFNGQDEYKIEENSFRVEPIGKPKKSKCSDCSSCWQCSPDINSSNCYKS